MLGRTANSLFWMFRYLERAENIARFHTVNGVIDARQVVAAAQAAGLHDMVLRLPKGYDTPLRDGGEQRSVAQAELAAALMD